MGVSGHRSSITEEQIIEDHRPCSPSPGFEAVITSQPNASSQLKQMIIGRLEPFTPENAVSAYHRSIEPWFPIAFDLQCRVQLTWEETSLDVTVLCLSIVLLATNPLPTASTDCNGEISEFETLYLQTKSSLAIAEGLGINTYALVQARLLITLLEIGHGINPAAYVSIGGTLRALDAREAHSKEGSLQPYGADGAVSHEETVLTWCGVLVLDR